MHICLCCIFLFFLGASVKGRLISDSSAGSMCIE